MEAVQASGRRDQLRIREEEDLASRRDGLRQDERDGLSSRDAEAAWLDRPLLSHMLRELSEAELEERDREVFD